MPASQKSSAPAGDLFTASLAATERIIGSLTVNVYVGDPNQPAVRVEKGALDANINLVINGQASLWRDVAGAASRPAASRSAASMSATRPGGERDP